MYEKKNRKSDRSQPE